MALKTNNGPTLVANIFPISGANICQILVPNDGTTLGTTLGPVRNSRKIYPGPTLGVNIFPILGANISLILVHNVGPTMLAWWLGANDVN